MIFIRGDKERELITNGGTTPSSMRFSMIVILELIIISVLSMLAIFIYEAIFKDDISFEKAGYFLGGLAALFASVTVPKGIQKKNEIKE